MLVKLLNLKKFPFNVVLPNGEGKNFPSASLSTEFEITAPWLENFVANESSYLVRFEVQNPTESLNSLVTGASKFEINYVSTPYNNAGAVGQIDSSNIASLAQRLLRPLDGYAEVPKDLIHRVASGTSLVVRTIEDDEADQADIDELNGVDQGGK